MTTATVTAATSVERHEGQLYWFFWVAIGVGIVGLVAGSWAVMYVTFFGGVAIMALSVLWGVLGVMAPGLQAFSLKLGDYLHFKAASRNRG